VNATAATLGRPRCRRYRSAATKVDVLCCDLMYGSASAFLRRAARARRPTMDGLAMLLATRAPCVHHLDRTPRTARRMRRALR